MFLGCSILVALMTPESLSAMTEGLPEREFINPGLAEAYKAYAQGIVTSAHPLELEIAIRGDQHPLSFFKPLNIESPIELNKLQLKLKWILGNIPNIKQDMFDYCQKLDASEIASIVITLSEKDKPGLMQGVVELRNEDVMKYLEAQYAS